MFLLQTLFQKTSRSLAHNQSCILCKYPTHNLTPPRMAMYLCVTHPVGCICVWETTVCSQCTCVGIGLKCVYTMCMLFIIHFFITHYSKKCVLSKSFIYTWNLTITKPSLLFVFLKIGDNQNKVFILHNEYLRYFFKMRCEIMQKGLVSLGVNERVNACLATKHVIGVLEFSAVLLLYQTTRTICHSGCLYSGPEQGICWKSCQNQTDPSIMKIEVNFRSRSYCYNSYRK